MRPITVQAQFYSKSEPGKNVPNANCYPFRKSFYAERRQFMAILSRFVVSKGSRVWTARGAVLLSLLSLTIVSGMQRTHLVISNARARVLAVDLTDKAEYRLVTGKGHSSVWISVADGILLQRPAGGVVTTTAGDAQEEKPERALSFMEAGSLVA